MIDDIITSILSSWDKGSFWTQEKIFFFKELSYMLAGGVSIVESIDIIARSSDNYAVKEIAKQCKTYLNEGRSLSYALTRLKEYFDDGDISIVKSWEKTGNLGNVLKSLAYEYSFINTIKGKYQGAMIYPTILIFIAFFAIIALFMFVLPGIFQIVEQFDSMKLPWITLALKNFSEFLRDQWVNISIWLGFVFGLVFLYVSTDVGKRQIMNLVFQIPVIGKMTKYYYLIRFCRYMKIMISAGMSYVEVFNLLKEILQIPAYTIVLEQVTEGLNKGQSIYDSLKYETNLIPTNAIVLMKVGEETANMPQALENIISIYEEDLNNLLNNLSKIIEPVMLVLIGGVIIVIATGVFGVITQIMEGIQTT